MKKTERNIRDSYKLYKEQTDDPISESDYVKICNKFNQYLTLQVREGFEVVLPERMGVLSIVGKKKELKFHDNGHPNLAINWPATWQLRKNNKQAADERKLVYHTNDHSDNVSYRYLWSKKRVLVTNKNLYSLRMTRANKRDVAYRVKQEGKEYFIKDT